MQKYINSAADATTGAALSGATISVYRTGTAVLATLYADASGTPKANPTVADSNGLYWFYALNGRYDIVISKIGYASVTLSDIELHDETEASDYGMQTTNSDNTGALQAAINAISARVGVNNSGGDVIEIPSGTHNFLGTVTIPNSFIRLIGSGRQSTYLAFYNGAADCIVVNGIAAPGNTLRDVSIENLGIIGAPKSAGAHIKIRNAYRITIKNVSLDSCITGIDIGNATNTIILDDVSIIPNQPGSLYGIYWHCLADGSTRSDVVSIKDVVIEGQWSNAKGFVWDGACYTLLGSALSILHLDVGMQILNTAASASNYPSFCDIHGAGFEGFKSRALDILGGTDFKFTDFDITNLTGASGQGNADDHSIYVGADLAASITRGIQLANGRIGLCRANGIYLDARDCQISNVIAASTSFSAAGAAATMRLGPNAADIQITNYRAEEFGGTGRSSYAIQLDAGATGIRGVNIDCAFCATGDILNNTGGDVGFVGIRGRAGAHIPYFGTLHANYANDAAAAAGGIPISGWYRNGSVLMQRVA